MASHSEPNLLQGQGASRLWRCVALCIVAFAALTPLKLRAANAPIGLWIAPDIPPEFQIAVDRLIKQGDFAAATQGEAKVKIVSGRPGDGPSAQWIYVPVAAFPTTIDNIAWPNIQRYWQGDATALAAISGSNTKIESPVFITTPTILAYLTGLLGAPDPQIHVETVAPDALAMTLWRHRPAAWAIIPFDRLDPTMKALTLDGKSAFDRSFDLSAYPLVQTIILIGDTDSFKTTVA
ncbi:MAG TPA: hypothetical protein VKQ72_04975, partial [Aggregatilineales bacterium]|nr:hypothetical protein [Aggregatilineales bacterium]